MLGYDIDIENNVLGDILSSNRRASQEKNEETTMYCLKISKEKGLYITGGSDCHGDFVKERTLGKPEIHLEQLELWKRL